MNQEINNQTPLYRFVSMRSAELSNNTNIKKRFVFYPAELEILKVDNVFFNAVINKPTSQTKMAALVSVCPTFAATAFGSQQAVIKAYPVYDEVADWITRNRANLNTALLQEKVRTLTVLPVADQSKLWDNLFYQIVTQADFYVKETILQLLVLQNILLHKLDADFAASLPMLVNAKLVLPTEIFEENVTTTQVVPQQVKAQTPRQKAIDNTKFEQSRLIADLKTDVENAKSLKKEITGIIDGYKKTYEHEYTTALTTFQQDENKRIADELSNTPSSNINSSTNTTTNNTSPSPTETTRFTFDKPSEPSIDELTSKLDPADLIILTQLVNLPTTSNLTTVVETLDTLINNNVSTIASTEPFVDSVVVVGTTVLPVTPTPQMLNFSFQIKNYDLKNRKEKIDMIVQLPDRSYQFKSIYYTLEFKDGTSKISGLCNTSLLNNLLTISDFFNNQLESNLSENIQEIKGVIEFTNGQQYSFSINPFNFEKQLYNGMLILVESSTGQTIVPPTITKSENAFVPSTFGYRQLGIADYRKVVASIDSYKVGEVAHIENIMARELREKVTTSFHQSQVIETIGSEVETEKLNDTSSTQRFEMQSEISKLLQEQKQFSAHLDVSASWPVVTINTGANYASNISKEESNRHAVNQSKELTQRAMERIVSKTKTEKTVKQTDEFTEENKHRFDNTQSAEHVSGVYRYINAVYKNQIYNYGKRLMYEFMIPQPCKLHQLLMQLNRNNINTVSLAKPIDPRIADKDFTDFTKIKNNNYQQKASNYNATVNAPPMVTKTINKTFSGAKLGDNEIFEGSADIEIPNGYIAKTAQLKFYSKWDTDTSQKHSVAIAIGNLNYYHFDENHHYDLKESDLVNYIPGKTNYDLNNFTEKLSVSYNLLNYLSFSISLSIICEPDSETYENWQKETYSAIISGYESQLAAYNESLAEAKATGAQLLDSNPLFYRQIEQTVLRTNCISYLLDYNNKDSVKNFGKKMYNGDTITNYAVQLDKTMDEYTSFVKFMEQAFEWELMSYSFYPFYWGNKDEWGTLYQFDSDDEIFRSFMQAGMARVVVTVKPGFEDAVMYYLAFGQIWNGGQMPVLGNPLYLSIVDELKEQEYSVDETWTTVLPTNLVALQKSGVSVDATGLPSGLVENGQQPAKLVGSKSTLGNGNIIAAEVVEKVEKMESRMIENVDIVDGYLKLTTDNNPRTVVAQISVEAIKRAINGTNGNV